MVQIVKDVYQEITLDLLIYVYVGWQILHPVLYGLSLSCLFYKTLFTCKKCQRQAAKT